MNPSVQKVFGLPELRERIFIYLLFYQNHELKISIFKILRLVCKPWLETANHCIYQNLRHIKDQLKEQRNYTPVKFNYYKIPRFIHLMENSCLKTTPQLPFQLVLFSSKRKLTHGEHHKAIKKLLHKFYHGLVKIEISSPCNLGKLHLPNLQILTAYITSQMKGNGFEKDIQFILDGAQESLLSFTLCITRVPPQAKVLPLRLPEKLQNLFLFSNVVYIETLLNHNINSILNLQHLVISLSTQITFANPCSLWHRLVHCPTFKNIHLCRHAHLCRNGAVCPFPLPESVKQLKWLKFDIFGMQPKPEGDRELLNASPKYPKWKELNIFGFSKEDLNMWTTCYPCEYLKGLTFRLHSQYRDRYYGLSLGLSTLHLERIHLAYPNITYLNIPVENQKSLEYIFTEMTNLKTLVVCHEAVWRPCINWDAVLIGCSKTEIKRLREDHNQDGNVIFVPNQEIPSIRNLRDLQTLILYAYYDIIGDIPDEYLLSDVAFFFAFLKMKSLLKLEIILANRISENVQQLWQQSQPNRSITVKEPELNIIYPSLFSSISLVT